MYQKMYEQHLSETFDITIVSNGLEVLDSLKQKKPDALLLDLNMPEMTGVQVLDYLKDSSYSFPIIIFSEVGEFMSKDKYEEYGIVGHLEKGSFEIKELPTLIEEILKKES